jgi:hypothetical protein
MRHKLWRKGSELTSRNDAVKVDLWHQHTGQTVTSIVRPDWDGANAGA